MEWPRHGRSHQCGGARPAYRGWRGQNRLPDRAHPGLRRAARVPHPLVFTDRPPAQNLVTAAERGVAALRDGRRSRMSVTPRPKAPSFAASLLERHWPYQWLEFRKGDIHRATTDDLVF